MVANFSLFIFIARIYTKSKEFEHIPFTQLIDRFIVSQKANSRKFLRMVSTIYENLLKYAKAYYL